MEKAKPSKKKAYYKNRKSDNQQVNNESPDWRQQARTNKTLSHIENDRVEKPIFSKRSLQQPESRLAELDEIWQETNVGQDFETLMNAPLSADGHFTFKSEKNWTLDASKYDDFFSVDVKNLATIVQCIPYNQYVEVDNKYFTRDELTDINNTAEQGRKAYDLMVESLNMKNNKSPSDENPSSRNEKIYESTSEESLPSAKVSNESCLDPTNIEEEDLDFLLSLKEPVRTHPVSIAPLNKSGLEDLKPKKVPSATKSIDLEKWLDLVLED